FTFYMNRPHDGKIALGSRRIIRAFPPHILPRLAYPVDIHTIWLRRGKQLRSNDNESKRGLRATSPDSGRVAGFFQLLDCRQSFRNRRICWTEMTVVRRGDMLEVIGAEAGMHLVALLPLGANDVAVSRQ